ncbi:hypothetical protein [Spartinivicinus ruber]|uniref:hypothetical protein n=1 Tax=Spartinivicinus ruber TaxID=2683272 RepID=UPI0013D83A23|nr:hypothetical protein [Spartinivicinus ruber]
MSLVLALCSVNAVANELQPIQGFWLLKNPPPKTDAGAAGIGVEENDKITMALLAREGLKHGCTDFILNGKVKSTVMPGKWTILTEGGEEIKITKAEDQLVIHLPDYPLYFKRSTESEIDKEIDKKCK